MTLCPKSWILAFLVISISPLAASERSEKQKIEKKFDVVVWGQTQSLTDNLIRVARQIAAQGGDIDVYRKRFEEVGGHWEDTKKEFARRGVDWNKDTIYFGHIDWVAYETVDLKVRKIKRPIDHRVRFYVAANLKKDESPTSDKISERLYVFSEGQYSRFNPTIGEIDKLNAVVAQDGWRGLSFENVDAAFVHPVTRNAYFFSGSEYERFDFRTEQQREDKNGVTERGIIGKDDWTGVWHDLDAAVFHPKRDMLYFFKGDKYQRFSISEDKVVGDGRTIGIDGWKGVMTHLDAAVLSTDGKQIYFIKGDRCQIFSLKADKVIQTSSLKEVFTGLKGQVKAALVRPEIELD